MIRHVDRKRQAKHPSDKELYRFCTSNLNHDCVLIGLENDKSTETEVTILKKCFEGYAESQNKARLKPD